MGDNSPMKTKHRDDREKQDLIKRLNKVEGQIRAIRNMVAEDRYCTDIIVQASAASAALDSFSKLLLTCHIKNCVIRDIREGKEETVEELIDLLPKLMK